MYPVTVRQTVKLGGNPQVGGLLTAGRTGAAVAGVGDVFYMPATRGIAVICLHAGDAGTTGEHFSDGFDFDITQATGVEKRGPALISCEQIFERTGLKPETTGRLIPGFQQSGESCRIMAMLQYGTGDHHRWRVHGLHQLNPVPFALRKLISGNGEQEGIDTFTGHHGEGSEKNM